ncbi:hypothetical protein RCO48_12315 [Peribacillus frigoritolerans]|nr:hypothetical protein [Peribacillus frigoritolerans]
MWQKPSLLKTQHTPVTLETAMSLDAVIAYLESMNGRMLQAEVLKTEK